MMMMMMMMMMITMTQVMRLLFVSVVSVGGGEDAGSHGQGQDELRKSPPLVARGPVPYITSLTQGSHISHQSTT